MAKLIQFKPAGGTATPLLDENDEPVQVELGPLLTDDSGEPIPDSNIFTVAADPGTAFNRPHEQAPSANEIGEYVCVQFIDADQEAAAKAIAIEVFAGRLRGDQITQVLEAIADARRVRLAVEAGRPTKGQPRSTRTR